MIRCTFYGILALLAAVGASPAELHFLYIGTTETNKWVSSAPIGRGVYATTLDTYSGDLSEPTLVARTLNPSFLVLDPNRCYLYTADDREATVSAYAVNAAGRLSFINRQSTGGTNVPHLAVDASSRMVVVPDYGSGLVCVFPTLPGGGLGPRGAYFRINGPLGPNHQRQSSA